MILSIDEYNRLEREAKTTACYPAIRCFHPTTFLKVGFPYRVEDERELIRYADIMGEIGWNELMSDKHLYSQYETAVMLNIAKRVKDISGIDPLSCLFGPIGMWRGIEYLSKGRQLTIMDVGSGSGYLDMYLATQGHEVLAVEVTQALYLWQNRFFANTESIKQVPWWEYAKMFQSPPKVDFVVCDAALGEMDAWAMHYTLRLAKLMNAPVLFRHVGEPYNNDINSVCNYANANGIPMMKIEICPSIRGEATLKISDFYNPINIMPSYAFMNFIGIN